MKNAATVSILPPAWSGGSITGLSVTDSPGWTVMIYLAHESQKIASQFRVDTPVAVEATSCQQKPPKGGQV
jgi:hypothetical protein